MGFSLGFCYHANVLAKGKTLGITVVFPDYL
jgi:hypothetical protein